MARRVDDQTFDLTDVAVGGINVLAALHLHLTRWDGVVGLQVSPRAAVAEIGPSDSIGRAIVRDIIVAGDELPLPGGIDAVEVRRGALQPYLVGGGVDQFDRD